MNGMVVGYVFLPTAPAFENKVISAGAELSFQRKINERLEN